MILVKKEIIEAKEFVIEEDYPINKDDFSACKDIVEVNSIHASLHAQYISGLVICKLHVSSDLVLRSTRTLKPVPYQIDDENEYTLTFERVDYEVDEDVIEVKGDKFDFAEDIVSMIITNIPLKIIGKDDYEEIKGDKWEVISEDEYERRKKEDIDPRLAIFADIEVDD